MIYKQLHNVLLFVLLVFLSSSCQSISAGKMSMGVSEVPEGAVSLPFLKNSPNECYFLDDFMPVPNNMVTGRSGSLDLRYYTYNEANYKEWQQKQITLSFYSKDRRCWALFEEYFIVE